MSVTLPHTHIHTQTYRHTHTQTHVHTQTDTHEECWYSCLSAAALQTASRGSALRLITSLPLLKSPSHLLPLSGSFHPFLPPPSHIVSLTLLTHSLRLALGTTDYLASIQNVIKENDQLPQLPPSFLPSALSSPPFF